jgi:hypothetical protein
VRALLDIARVSTRTGRMESSGSRLSRLPDVRQTGPSRRGIPAHRTAVGSGVRGSMRELLSVDEASPIRREDAHRRVTRSFLDGASGPIQAER